MKKITEFGLDIGKVSLWGLDQALLHLGAHLFGLLSGFALERQPTGRPPRRSLPWRSPGGVLHRPRGRWRWREGRRGEKASGRFDRIGRMNDGMQRRGAFMGSTSMARLNIGGRSFLDILPAAGRGARVGRGRLTRLSARGMTPMPLHHLYITRFVLLFHLHGGSVFVCAFQFGADACRDGVVG